MPGQEINAGQIKGTLVLNGKKFNSVLDKAGKKAKKFEKQQKKLSKSVGKSWKKTFLGISAAAVTAFTFRAIIREGAGVEKAFANISTLGNFTVETMKEMEDGVKSLSVVLRKTEAEQAAALYQAISAGAKAGAEALGVLKEATKFAVAGLTDTKTSVDAITNAMNVFGKETLSANRAANLMFKTIQLGKTTAEELAPQLGRVLSRAKALGLSFEQASAGVALLTRTMPTPLAITSLEGALRGLSDASDEFAKAGIDIFQVLKEEGLSGALRRLQKLTGGNVKEIKKFVTDGRALRGILSLLKEGGEAYNEMLVKMKDKTDVVNEAVEKQMNTTESRTDGLKVAFASLAKTIFREIQPAYDRFLKVATSVLKVSDRLITSTNRQAKATKSLVMLTKEEFALIQAGIPLKRKLSKEDAALLGAKRARLEKIKQEEAAEKKKLDIVAALEKKAADVAKEEAILELFRFKRAEENLKVRARLATDNENSIARRLAIETDAAQIESGRITLQQNAAEEQFAREIENEALLERNRQNAIKFDEDQIAADDKAFEKKLRNQARDQGVEDKKIAETVISAQKKAKAFADFNDGLAKSLQSTLVDGWSSSLSQFMATSKGWKEETFKMKDLMDGVWDDMKAKGIKTMIDLVAKQLIQAGIAAVGWMPAAALSATATAGGSASAASIAISSLFSMISGKIPKREQGGPISEGLFVGHPDEVVLSKQQTEQTSEVLTKILARFDGAGNGVRVILEPKGDLLNALIAQINIRVEDNQVRLSASNLVA